ncbi:MAG: mannose-1-phosphate guanylyltransferase/mannose-6-phosphate isomerase [Coriobacteriia bacterium]|nr:mannose-1-phosphate guanylyltransferase/mannose-6-phosphate isomerase [Coriobacteriia bacterium]
MSEAREGTAGRVHGIILAGGLGQRFWPISRELSPKQLLSMFGTESLIAQAVHRVLPVLTGGETDVLIVTSERLVDELRNHMTAQDDEHLHHVRYLVEPMGRNTAPAIALACASVAAKDPEGIVIVLPSDHVLDAGEIWFDAVASAVSLARDGYFATIGITPTRPETGYGYIRRGAALPQHSRGAVTASVADAFVEKPDAATAETYLADGGYLWNAGVFVMRAAGCLAALDAHADTAPISAAAREIAAGMAGEEARERFGALPALSIDVAVMERVDCVAVVAADVGWSDVGSLMALETLAPADESGNVRIGRGVDVNSTGTVVYTSERLVATLGVSDLIVVDTADATLITHKDAAQDVRLVVEALKAQGADEVVQPQRSLRPWGSWRLLLEAPGYKVKEIEVKPGCRLSLQRHEHRSENWVVAAGRARVMRGEDTVHLEVGESVYLRAGTAHRLENPGDELLRIVEIQTGEYLGEDDIERIEDDWHRDDPAGD